MTESILVTTAEAAQAFGVKPTTVRVWVHRRKIPVLDRDEAGRQRYDYAALNVANNAYWKRTSGRRRAPEREIMSA